MFGKRSKPLLTDCLACMLRPLLHIGKFFGITPISFKCSHTKNIPDVNFMPSITAITISCLILATITILLVSYTLTITIYQKDLKSLYESFIEVLAFIQVFGTCLICLLKRKEKLLELNGLDRIIENKRYYQITNFISDRSVKKFIYQVYFVFVVALITDLMFIWYYGQNTFNITRSIFWTCVKHCLNSLVVLAHSVILYVNVFTANLHKKMYKKCLRTIKKILTKNLRMKMDGLGDNPNNLPLEISLKRMNRLYLSIGYSYRQLVNFSSWSGILWLTTMCGILIMSFYLMSIYYNEMAYIKFNLLLQSSFTLIVMAIYISYLESVKNVGNELLPFLFKFPISKLNTGEAAQVELLIIALRCKKPVMNASNIINIDCGVLAPFAGTVVTYVLVALQFYAK